MATTMNITISTPRKNEIFFDIFKNIKVFTENLNINIKTDGIYIQTMDASHISVFELTLPRSWFDEYNIHQDVVVGVNTVLMFKILSTRETNQSTWIGLSNDDSDTMEIRFQYPTNTTSDKKNLNTKAFQIPLVDIDTEILTIPEMEYEAEFALSSAYFAELVNEMKMFGSNIGINCTEEEIKLNTNSMECGNMSVTIKIEDLSSFEIEEDKQIDSSYSLTHLSNIMQFNKVSNQVKIHITENNPLKIQFMISEEEDANIYMFLAPRIGDDL